MSRNAVSGEHLAIAAHLLVVRLPSKPSSRRVSNPIVEEALRHAKAYCKQN
jgi:hypothetical protein